jgi:hypothetical protein
MNKFLNLAVALLFALEALAQRVVINEIMNAPSGGEPEWIEILNFSSEPINLKNWKISNRFTDTKYTITTQDYFLQPDSYAVITKSDTIYNFHAYIPSKVFIVPQLPSSRFRNDSDAVVLFDSTGLVIDSVYYKSSWVRSGYSIERIYPNLNSNFKSTWGISIDPERSTPGRKNSIMAKFNNISIKTFATEPSQIFQGQDFKVKTTVYNLGINTVENFSLQFFIDLNKDLIFQDNEEFADSSISYRLNSTDSIMIELHVPGLLSGDYQALLEVVLINDEDVANNVVNKTISILKQPLSFNSIVINEIMYAPKSPEPEWVELYNRTNESVNLKNWRIGDSQTLRVINVDFIIGPNDFAVITSKDTLITFYPWLKNSEEKILILSLPILNNDEDAVRIYDSYGNLIDSVYYLSSMGGTNGRSLERISPEQPSNLELNWGTSKSPFKATPLLKNSLTQKDKDLTITDCAFSKPVLRSIPVDLKLIVKNIGKLPIENFNLKIFEDENLIDEKTFTGRISPGDSTEIIHHFTPQDVKTYNLIAKVFHPEDEDTLNNTFNIKIDISLPEGTILISEIMYAPLGDEPEWVEIYNPSENVINLRNWQISDATSKVTLTSKDFLIQPGEYVVLSKDSSILNFYQISSRIITLSLPAFNNTEDAVVIYDHTETKIDSVWYLGTWGKPGFSIERIDLDEPSTDSSNWSIPADSLKATPGRENSVKRKNFDLRILSAKVPSLLGYGDFLNVEVTVQNFGLKQVTDFSIKVFKDSTETEQILNQRFQITLNKKDSATVNLAISDLGPGENNLTFFIDFALDENLKNNKLTKKINVSYPSSCITINEIMFDPLSGYCEYIELFNRHDKPINLKNWKFNDMRNQEGKANFITLVSSDLMIYPNEFVVIASDSTIYNYLNPNDSIDFKIIMLNKSLNLNNDFDDVVISDLTGKIIDSVRYFSTWHSSMLRSTKGISLEKVNPDLPSHERSSWSSSSSKIGGTLGRKNSAFIELSTQPQTVSLVINPNPFSPDRDGFNDVCLISYTLPFNSGIINAKIFDSNGRLVKTLANNQFSNRSGNLIWDGTGDDGRILRIGIYIILFEATSENGETFRHKSTIVLAKRL